MNLVVTAGNTLVPIDRVRCLTNIFTGRTGAQIALEGYRRGHRVALLTSHPEAVAETCAGNAPSGERWSLSRYRTFEDLQVLMEETIQRGGAHAVIHSAAVSDYLCAGVYAPAPFTHFRADDGHWESATPELPALVDRRADKVKSDVPELWLRLVRAPKLIDQIRTPWGFRGVLVKFKLEVDVAEARLLEIAERSRTHSQADFMVANTLEGAASWAYLGPCAEKYERIARPELAARLLDAVERFHAEALHG